MSVEAPMSFKTSIAFDVRMNLVGMIRISNYMIYTKCR